MLRARPAAGRARTTLVPEKAAQWLWRCHIDLSTPNPATLDRLLPYVQTYPHSVFHLQDYVPAGMGGAVHIVPPAIDPLTPKNMALSPEDAAYVCDQFGIDADRPLLVQVSRFDPWKDPLGVIDAYRAVKERIPEVQLALVGSMASDDPEGWEFFNSTLSHADGDEDIKILNNFNGVGAIEVNAFQSPRRRRDPEVDARGLRPDGDRGALEGQAVHRRRRRRDPAAGAERDDRLPRRQRRGVRGALHRTAQRTRSWAATSAAAARSMRGVISSRPAICATI